VNQITELIVDAYGCRADLNDLAALERAAVTAITRVGARVANVAKYRFQPHGATLCLILMESHFVVSTWPEHNIAIVNIFLCNSAMNAEQVWEEFSRALLPSDCTFHRIPHAIPQVKTDVA